MPQLRLPKGTEERHKKAQEQVKEVMPDWMEGILDMIGMGPNTPIEDQIAGGLQPNPMGAVSMFMGKAGGGVAARQASTKGFLEQLEGLIQRMGIGPDQAAKMRELTNKYPRVAAHAGITEIPNNPEGVANFNSTGGGLGMIGVTPRAVERSDMAHSFAHELGHAAQNVGRKSFRSDYNKANDVVGYFDNPFERSARAIADRKVPMQGQDLGAETFHLLKEMGLMPNAKRPRGPQPATVALRKILDPS